MTARRGKAWAITGGMFGLGLVLALAAWIGSEALISQRYTLPSSIIAVTNTPATVARGDHLARIAGCDDCHTAAGAPVLTGRRMALASGLSLPAPNLRRFMAENGAGLFDIAVRRALSPDAEALWAMPVAAYAALSDDDMAAIIAYVQSLKVEGPVWRGGKSFSFGARLAVLAGTLSPANPYLVGARGPRWLGERYAGGQYLARLACSSCHGPDLSGRRLDASSAPAPDLHDLRFYTRAQFFALMREGRAAPGRHAPAMAKLAARRFSGLKDYELDALYAYLAAWASSPAP